LQQGHERDLNGPFCFELHGADRALDCGSRFNGTTDEYVAAASGKQEQRETQNSREEALHKSPRAQIVPLLSDWRVRGFVRFS